LNALLEKRSIAGGQDPHVRVLAPIAGQNEKYAT
jgi:hypothetical protein